MLSAKAPEGFLWSRRRSVLKTPGVALKGQSTERVSLLIAHRAYMKCHNKSHKISMRWHYMMQILLKDSQK